MTSVEVNGARLQVERIGAGPTTVVLHGGLGIDHQPYRSLDPLADLLQLVYYDHRGNGRSTGDPATMTMSQWAADAATLGAQVTGGTPAILLGHSFGGFIAQEAAIAHPDAVAALILVTTTPGQLGVGESPAPEGPPMPAEFAALLAEMPETDDRLAAFMSELLPAYVHHRGLEELRRLMAPVVFRAAAMRRGFEELATWSSVDRLAGVEAPALVIAGRHDAFTAWPQAERIADRLPDAEVEVFEHSGHFPWLEEPDRFFAVVTDWLRRRGLVGRPATSGPRPVTQPRRPPTRRGCP